MKQLSTILILLLSIGCYAQKSALVADDAELTLVAADYKFTEGPAMDKNGDVYFTDQPNNRIIKWSASDNSVSVYMEEAGRANGLYFDHDGSLLACADENFELWKIDNSKNHIVLVDEYQEKKLNGPNDLWVDLKGGIYFTDPYYQRPYWQRKEKEIEEERVYYLTPDRNELRIVADDLVQPNGIIGTPDGKMIYIADIGDKKTYSFSISENGDLRNKKLFTEMGSDGMTIDNQGNVYLTGNGVTVFNKKGEEILQIPVPQKWTANVTFGGPDQNVLFITAMNSVYTMDMNVYGVR
ncbi:SMP-30/gluconolactonase/LRE family protein [uncultured Eudoraea sp.]|uniref:SMP-30/gluconolactonase/LRE family protein n=1 Tax=uncultured Eudoraea sp. TaxID=1035614 RepID=UPI0026112213|nr:SMP-30/gluconolactonase/LRE family protein [uncultured Eudoraea sp.]